MILFYHGITEGLHPRERWCIGQALPLSSIEQQLNWLRRNRRIVPLGDYIERTAGGRMNGRNLVALTFDDGLACTFKYVYPLLKTWSIPATFFISTFHLEQGRLLWFSYLNALCFEGVYDEVKVGDRRLPLSSLEDRIKARRSVKAMARASGNPHAFSANLESLYPLPPSVKAHYAGMTCDQLSLVRDSDFIEAGAHTLTHPYLDQLSRQEQAGEICESKRLLSTLTGKPVRYFAYPSGDYNRDTLRIVEEAGFEAAFATWPKQLGADERFEIARVGIYSPSFFKFWLKTKGVATLARNLGLAIG